jgi:hypothetical protein
MSCTHESIDRRARKILVCEKAHVRLRGKPFRSSTGRERSSASRDVFPGQAGIICENVGFAPTIGHQANYELNREPRASDNRLSSQNGWIEYDMVVRRCHDLSYQTTTPAPILSVR